MARASSVGEWLLCPRYAASPEIRLRRIRGPTVIDTLCRGASTVAAAGPDLGEPRGVLAAKPLEFDQQGRSVPRTRLGLGDLSFDLPPACQRRRELGNGLGLRDRRQRA